MATGGWRSGNQLTPVASGRSCDLPRLWQVCPSALDKQETPGCPVFLRRPLSLAAISLSLLPLSWLQPAQARPERCSGTLLQLQVQQNGTTDFDRFRFNVGVEADGPTGAEAITLLNARLESLRGALQPLVSGRLTVPAPNTYPIGGGPAGPKRQRATTTVSGVVTKANYNAVIQAAARMPGMNLQGFSALPSSGSEAALQAKLMRQALAEGGRQAKVTADALGLKQVQLLRIDQRGGGGPRPMPYLAAARSFNPDEAPAPSNSLSLALDYCLS
jgi:hypothetical protein